MTKEFIEAVSSDAKIRVRIMLKDSMLVDPTLRQFESLLKYAETNMPGLYDVHNAERLEYRFSEWNETYLNSQMVAVVGNFSTERVDLLKQMVKHLYREKAERIIEKEREAALPFTRKQVGMGVTAVGATAVVAGVAGACACQTALIAGGAIGVVVGIGLILTDTEE